MHSVSIEGGNASAMQITLTCILQQLVIAQGVNCLDKNIGRGRPEEIDLTSLTYNLSPDTNLHYNNNYVLPFIYTVSQYGLLDRFPVKLLNLL